MRIRSITGLVLAVALTACGQQASDQGAASASGSPAHSNAENQAAVAALPAPYNQASYEAGRTVFAQCRSCHTLAQGGADMVGPNLHGVIGRHIGAAANFNYSPPVREADFVWDAAHLDPWIANPQAMLPGTRMAFAGVRDATQRRDVIAYLMVETAR